MRLGIVTVVLLTIVPEISSQDDVLSLITSISAFSKDDLGVIGKQNSYWHTGKNNLPLLSISSNPDLQRKILQFKSRVLQLPSAACQFITKVLEFGYKVLNGQIENDAAWKRLQNEMLHLSSVDCRYLQLAFPQLSKFGDCGLPSDLAIITSTPISLSTSSPPPNCTYARTSYELEAIGHLQDALELFRNLSMISMQKSLENVLKAHVDCSDVKSNYDLMQKRLETLAAALRNYDDIPTQKPDADKKLVEALIHISSAAQAYLKILLLDTKPYEDKLSLLQNLNINDSKLLFHVLEAVLRT